MLDLARVLEIEPGGYVVSAWPLLEPSSVWGTQIRSALMNLLICR
jgi:hypothetical protein